jgi:protein-tyrosine phosphatase
MPAILFVCTANQFRSPLAAACLIQIIDSSDQSAEAWQITSAGTWTSDGEITSSATRKIAQQLGLPGVDQHRTRSINGPLLQENDLIIVMEAHHKEALSSEFPEDRARVFMLSEVTDGYIYDFPDPLKTGDDLFESATELCTKIKSSASKILKLAESLKRS